MKLPSKISALIFMLFLMPVLSAQDNICNVRKSYAVRKGSTLKFSNKYGDVNVITVNEDSLSICAVITIIQDEEPKVRKSMKLITINIDQKKDTVYVATLFDRKFFSEEARQGRKSFSVDYILKMPAYINLSIKNEFGKLSIDEMSGPLNLRLSQGSLTARKLTRGSMKPVNTIYADHSKVEIDEINWLSLTLLNCPEVIINKAQALNVKSVISNIRIGNASSLVINSKSDKYHINSLNKIISEGTYSTFEIGGINDQLESKFVYGSLNVTELKKGFRNVNVTSTNSNISMTTETGASFTGDISATDGILEFPAARYPGIIKASGNGSVTLTGLTGSDKNTESVIKIRSTGGKLILK